MRLGIKEEVNTTVQGSKPSRNNTGIKDDQRQSATKPNRMEHQFSSGWNSWAVVSDLEKVLKGQNLVVKLQYNLEYPKNPSNWSENCSHNIPGGIPIKTKLKSLQCIEELGARTLLHFDFLSEISWGQNGVSALSWSRTTCCSKHCIFRLNLMHIHTSRHNKHQIVTIYGE